MSLKEKIRLMVEALDLRISSLEFQRSQCWKNYPADLPTSLEFVSESEFNEYSLACNLSGEIDGLRRTKWELVEILESGRRKS